MHLGSGIYLLGALAAVAISSGDIVAGNFIPQQQQLQQQQQQDAYAINNYQPQLAPNQLDLAQLQQQLENSQQVSDSAANLDLDDDDDEEDRVELQPTQQQQQLGAASSALWQNGQALINDRTAASDQAQNSPLLPSDLKPAASKHYHHHKHGAKGWLDMGAWTGKKGAFGWHDKHPVGKGRK